ncbi:MAG: pyruvate, water dikinase regulatory protein, partial [Rubripirellula sp.]
PVFVVSGGTGLTAKRVLMSALAQFPDLSAGLVEQVEVRSAARARAIAREAAECDALVCHSIVDPAVRKAFDEETRAMGVPCVDVLGPAIALLGDHFGAEPRGRAGLMYELHREQLERIDAVDFTLAHDDGQRMRDLRQADIVLVGASRTSKSVTCFYLASRGFRAANVPLIPQIPLPQELKRLPHRRVVGLTMSAAHLESIRQTRLDHLSDRPVARYAELSDIRSELREIRETMEARQWECIDVSYKATEEVADQIIDLMPKKRPRRAEAKGAAKCV